MLPWLGACTVSVAKHVLPIAATYVCLAVAAFVSGGSSIPGANRRFTLHSVQAVISFFAECLEMSPQCVAAKYHKGVTFNKFGQNKIQCVQQLLFELVQRAQVEQVYP